ncbi:hypothetical protein EMGBS15_13460 [Filimonas sp.]|nr:hypothetical protein EMGBS15_13460 [Filimonas sp.]
MIQYSVNIEVPLAMVWSHFHAKIEHPENFVPGVSDVQIKEKTDDHVIRSMHISMPDGTGATVVEQITHTPYKVRYLVIDHPVYSGYVDNIAEPVSEQVTNITYVMHWVNKQSGEPFTNEEIAKNAVLKTIAHILASVSGM